MRTIIAAMLIAVTSLACPALADEYPSRTVVLIDPYKPGGGIDVVSHMLALGMKKLLKQSVIIEYKPGAAGTVAAGYVSRANPDGYTLLVTLRAITLAPSIYKHISFDPVKSFEPVSLVTRSIDIFCVHPSVPAHSLKQFIRLAEEHPGRITFSSSGVGGDQALTVDMFAREAHINLMQIPYNGGNPAAMALLSGQADSMLMPASFGFPFVQQHKVRALAVNDGSRTPLARLPNVPTFAQLGFGDLTGSWSAVLAPKGTPHAIVRKLNAVINEVLRTKAAKAYYHDHFLRILGGSSRSLGRHISEDVVKWHKIIQEVGLKPR